jgi:hypothetical protein
VHELVRNCKLYIQLLYHSLYACQHSTAWTMNYVFRSFEDVGFLC